MTGWYNPDFARYYQTDAADAVMAAWQAGTRNTLIELPTGTGKSITLGTIARRVADQLKCKVAILTHVKELVEQDADAVQRVWGDVGSRLGINSAALGRRDVNNDVIVASVQSIQRKPKAIGERHVLIVDEAQLISRKSSSMYGRVIAELSELNPGMCMVGLTATPYRLDSGLLTQPYKGSEPLFDEIVYSMGIRRAIEEAWLAPVTARATKMRLDVSGVHRRGGEFVAGELEAAVNKDDINRSVIDETMDQLKNGGRNMALICASGKDHAHALAKLVRERHNANAGVLLGDTPDAERSEMVRAGRDGDLRVMIGVNAILVGLDIPMIDVIAAVRPTESKGLWTQAIGRGTRPIWTPGMPVATMEDRVASMQAGPKRNGLLVLDFAGNTLRHGPLDMIDGRKNESSKPAPQKECPQCATIMISLARTCPTCGHEFPFQEQVKITGTAAGAPIVSTDEPPVYHTVDNIMVRKHVRIDEEGNEKVSLRIDYLCGVIMVSRWLSIESENPYSRMMCERWWAKHSKTDLKKTGIGSSTCPNSVEEAISRARAGELRCPGRILCKKEGKYWRVVDEDFSVEPILEGAA